MPAASSAPSRSTVHDASERRGGRRSRGVKEFSCETCGKVYRHPNCLVKHRWEHNPYWTEASQFLLSKHQQVQLMEAAAILTRGPSLPSDRALWPSYMSDGVLPSPAIAGDGTPREKNPFHSTLAPSPTSFTEHPSVSDDEEEGEEHQVHDMASDGDSLQEEEDQDDKTDESDVPLPLPLHSYPTPTRPSVPHRATAPVDIRRASLGPARTHHESRSSIGYTPYCPPRGISSPRWGVIGEAPHHHHPLHLATSPPTGHRGYLDQQSAHRTTPTTGKPMAIPTPRSPYSRPQSFSSFSSITQSLGSSSTSSHIPSSSIRSVDAEEEEDDYEDAYGSHYQHAAPPSAGSNGMKWSPPQPAPRTVYEDLDELEMMDMD